MVRASPTVPARHDRKEQPFGAAKTENGHIWSQNPFPSPKTELPPREPSRVRSVKVSKNLQKNRIVHLHPLCLHRYTNGGTTADVIYPQATYVEG